LLPGVAGGSPEGRVFTLHNPPEPLVSGQWVIGQGPLTGPPHIGAWIVENPASPFPQNIRRRFSCCQSERSSRAAGCRPIPAGEEGASSRWPLTATPSLVEDAQDSLCHRVGHGPAPRLRPEGSNALSANGWHCWPCGPNCGGSNSTSASLCSKRLALQGTGAGPGLQAVVDASWGSAFAWVQGLAHTIGCFS